MFRGLVASKEGVLTGSVASKEGVLTESVASKEGVLTDLDASEGILNLKGVEVPLLASSVSTP